MLLKQIELGSISFKRHLINKHNSFDEALNDFYSFLKDRAFNEDIINVLKEQVNTNYTQLLNEFKLEQKKEELVSLQKNKVNTYNQMIEQILSKVLIKINNTKNINPTDLTEEESINYLIKNPNVISNFLQNITEDKYDNYDESFIGLNLDISIEDVDIKYIVNNYIINKNKSIHAEMHYVYNKLKSELNYIILPTETINKLVNQAEVDIDNLIKDLSL